MTISTSMSGMAAACRDAGCALLGGETAEMPGVYLPNELDVVGTIVGVVDRADVIDSSDISIGDVVIGISSSGLHTNGFSLARRIFEHWDLNERVAALGTTLGSALLAPHRSYLDEVTALGAAGVNIHSLVHVTGGGLIDNPARVLPDDAAMRIDRSAWLVPPLFSLIQTQGNIEDREMFRAFNMGLGMLVVVAVTDRERALSSLGPDACVMGAIVPRADEPVELIP